MFGPRPQNQLPEQDVQKILLLARRWERAAEALKRWAEGEKGVIVGAKECVDFFEGRQWTAEQIADLESQGRLPLKYNKIGRLVRLVLGYQRNNKTEVSYLPSADALSNMNVAEVLNLVAKQIALDNDLEFIDTEVFLDGITSGRGWFDTRLSWEDNDFGDIEHSAVDPFTVYPDPEGNQYDINKSSTHISVSRWASIDEAEWMWGPKVASYLRPYTAGHSWNGFPTQIYPISDETAPLRYFGIEEDLWEPYGGFRDLFENEFVDNARKNIRVIDMQHYITELTDVFIDLETGDRAIVPPEFTPEDVEKAIYYAEMVDNPLTIMQRPVKRVRWTTLVGDILVYDDWSMYDTFTLTPYFPYFRRGYTHGMVNDLIDPQKGINKHRSAMGDIISRTANSGWLSHENALTAPQRENFKRFGATAGVLLEWQGEKEPKKIDPSPPPMALERLKDDDNASLQEISGINESALGEIDKVQSGRAIEARQRQAVIAIQIYMDNFKRSKILRSKKELNLVQKFYSEERIVRAMGDDGRMIEKVINQRAGADITNDITRGKYTVTVDEQPLSATFASAQFEEMILMIEKLQGALPPEAYVDHLIDLSSLPRKEELKQRVQMILGLPPIDPMDPNNPAGPNGGTAISTGVVPVPGAPPNVVPINPAAAQG